MVAILRVLFTGLVLCGLSAGVAWGWATWRRLRPRLSRGRAVASVAGLIFVSLSALLEIGSDLYSEAMRNSSTDGTASLVSFHVAGFTLAALGLVSLFGGAPRNPARWTTPVLSACLMVIWALRLLAQDLW